MFQLLRSRKPTQNAPTETPFPSRQMLILALCRICEPIAFTSIFPYIYYMIKSFDITSDERQIAVYTGMVTSAFAFAEFSAGVVWGRLSDLVGRKPVLLTGLAGTGLSMLIFGFAPNLQVALLARALGGLLNGNLGVLQTTVAEVVTVKEHRRWGSEPTLTPALARAYAIMPSVWCLGTIVGSGLGGTLAEPAANFPWLFPPGSIFERFPFLLPNLICAAIVVLGLLVGVLFLEETHEKKKHRRDVGLELGEWISRQFRRNQDDGFHYSKLNEDANFEETPFFFEDNEHPPGYSSAEGSPRLAALSSTASIPSDFPTQRLDDDVEATKPRTLPRKVFNKQVLLTIMAYGILAYHTITFDNLMPVLLSMEDTHEKHHLPFRFTGGYGWPTSTIGFVLSLQGVYQILATLVVFPAVVNRLGPLKTFRLVALTYPLLYLATPYLTVLPHNLRTPGLFLVLVWKVTYQALAYPSTMLFLTNSSPSLLVLGSINGVAASAASLSRAFGPTFSGLIESSGLKLGYSGLAWWASAAIALSGAIECLFMRERPGSNPYKKDDDGNDPTRKGAAMPCQETKELVCHLEEAQSRLSGVSEASTLVEDSSLGIETVQVLPKY